MNCHGDAGNDGSVRTRPYLHILGGWQVNGITTLRGGFPTDIRTNRLPPIFNTFNVPDRVPGEPCRCRKIADRTASSTRPRFASPARRQATPGAPIQLFGDSARRVARGPGSRQLRFFALQAGGHSASGTAFSSAPRHSI